MSEEDYTVDDTDEQILMLVQEDARNNTNTSISDEIGVSPSTVGKRLNRLEETGIVKGYYPSLDYEQAGFPLRVLFICTAKITNRRDLIDQALDLSGVVDIKELMTGEENVHIEVVGNKSEDVTELATAIDELGFSINEEILVKNDFARPASVFTDNL